MHKSILVVAVIGGLLWADAAYCADVKKPTAIVCVFDETKSLTSFDNYSGGKKSSKVRSWFTRWLFSNDNASKTQKIRFLWTPNSPDGPSLQIKSKDTNHVLVRLMSQTRDSVVAASSASDILTAVGWLFSINFKLEQVMATSVRSNAAGMKSEAVRLSCSFNDESPQVDKPRDKDTG